MGGVLLSARRDTVVGLALLFGACAPQIVDAVDPGGSGAAPVAGHGGSSGNAGLGSGDGGGRGGTSPRGGSGGTTSEAGAPGVTGCDALGSAGLDRSTCEALVGSLVHRYTFDGAGTAVTDTWGGPSGTVVNSTLTGDGAVTLAGHMSDQYVDLPNGILSALESATLEMWLTWSGGYEWQRLLDFGNDETGVEGAQSSGDTYLFVTPRLPDSGKGLLRVAYQRGTEYPEVQLDATRTLPSGRLTQVAVTFDANTGTLAVYIDGSFENDKTSELTPITLAALEDVNNWLGRSQYAADPDLNATLEEFRIYARALRPSELHASFEAGPNPIFLDGAAP